MWEGGPQPWPLQPSSHYHSVTSEDENMLKLTSLKEWGGAVYVYSLECLQLGETVVTLSVGNKPSSSLPKPVVVSSTVKVICGTPASIHLTPLIHAPQVGLYIIHNMPRTFLAFLQQPITLSNANNLVKRNRKQTVSSHELAAGVSWAGTSSSNQKRNHCFIE